MKTHVDKFINQLLKKIDRLEGVASESKIHITDHAYHWYFALSNSIKTELHQALESIEFLNIQYQRKVALGAFRHIEYIHVMDGRRFMHSKGIIPQADEIKDVLDCLDMAKFNVPWWEDMKKVIAQAWSCNKTFYGVRRIEVGKLLDAMKVVEWIVQFPVSESPPDIRTLSALLFGDSKRLENGSFSGLIRNIMLPYLDDDVMTIIEDCTQLLEYFGIGKYPQPIRFKSDGLLYCRGIIRLSSLRYGIGVSPDEVKGIEWENVPSYVLFIENRASFERYVREIDDPGIIIYTAGFPSRSWLHAVEILIKDLRDIVPIYHWGDRDSGGYRILAFLTRRLDVNIQPYLMDVETQPQTYSSDTLEDKPVAGLIKALESARDYPAISALYDDLTNLSQNSLPWIEQEQIFPISPLKFDMS